MGIINPKATTKVTNQRAITNKPNKESKIESSKDSINQKADRKK